MKMKLLVMSAVPTAALAICLGVAGPKRTLVAGPPPVLPPNMNGLNNNWHCDINKQTGDGLCTPLPNDKCTQMWWDNDGDGVVTAGDDVQCSNGAGVYGDRLRLR